MIRYIINRLLLMLLVMFCVLLFVFTLSRAPGNTDPVIGVLGEHYTQEAYDAMYIKLGLDKPIVTQFVDYVVGVVTRLDLGTSYMSKKPVADEVISRLPTSLRLSMTSVMFSVTLGVLLGTTAAYKQYSAYDYAVTTVSMLGQAIPNFWQALMYILIFALHLRWLPASGLADWKGYILPGFVMASTPIAVITRTMRATMLDVIRQDYIRTARSKGVNETQVLFKHALQNAAIPVVAQVGNQISTTIAGAAVVESIFGIAGLGSFLIHSIGASDHPATQGTVLMFSMFVAMINIILDIIYGYIDPRIKAKYTTSSRTAKKLNKLAQKNAKGVA